MGPLDGVTVIELGGIGPVPFCGMLLADMGARVIRVARPNPPPTDSHVTALLRGRLSIVVDLKHPRGVETILRLAGDSDALIEGFRPGVAERLGVGPDVCLGANPRLVYGRMTGWGQEGPLAGAAGHDINYIALAGVLDLIGPAGGAPTVPLNLIGDFGGGGLLLALGVVSGLLEARSSGIGQVVDAAMVDGAALLTTMVHGMRAAGLWPNPRGENLLDGGAPFYRVYETADRGFVSVGAVEPAFFAELVERLGVADEDLGDQYDPSSWPDWHRRLEEVFASKSSQEWEALLEGTNVCFAPVLSAWEACNHPHLLHRGTFVEIDGSSQPAPAPRFSRTQPVIPSPAPVPGQHTDQVLAEAGYSAAEVKELRAVGAVK